MASNVVGFMNDDLVTEILSRLPTKSICKFRCVSKSWNCFISYVFSKRKFLPMSGFIFHTGESNPTVGFYSPISTNPSQQEESYRFFNSRLTSLPFSSTHYVSHSCNGLILFTQRESVFDTTSHYYVWNPISMEVTSLPKRPKLLFSFCFLAFDPRESPHYRVVRLTFNSETTCVLVEIYSSLTQSWVDIHVPPSNPARLYSWIPMAVYLRGALYLFTHYNRVPWFDVDNGSFHSIDLPVKLPGFDTRFACIGESRGCLYYMLNLVRKFELHVYMLDGEEWLLTHKTSTKVLDQHPLNREPDCDKPSVFLQPVALHPESEVIYLSTRSKILSYHPTSGRMEEVCRLSDYSDVVDWVKVFRVIPCLESMPGGKLIDPNGVEDDCM